MGTTRYRKTKIVETKGREWRKLTERVSAFQGILRILIEYDERRQQRRRESPDSLHFLRKAASICKPEELSVYLFHKGGFLYNVLASYQNRQGRFFTVWLHEDGIRAERELFADIQSHPVHRILCLSDLYENNSMRLDTEELESEILPFLPEGEGLVCPD